MLTFLLRYIVFSFYLLISAFIARLNIGADVLVENVNTLPKFKDADSSDYVSAQSNIDSGPEFCTPDEIIEGILTSIND